MRVALYSEDEAMRYVVLSQITLQSGHLTVLPSFLNTVSGHGRCNATHERCRHDESKCQDNASVRAFERVVRSNFHAANELRYAPMQRGNIAVT
mmetsp:Transcript_97382/g.152200  ORF Transcript_97382/g.152200 Transcript_97382/m.152200 type:complete len:94 (-) Transcript_97382:259-540(-)